MTQAAQVAKLIRQELKAKYPQIVFRVRSENFSMGNAVDISYKNGVPTKEIEAIVAKYQAGNFNGMIDLYEYRPNPQNLPGVKFVNVQREIDPASFDQTKADIARKFGIADINNDRAWFEVFQAWPQQVVWRELQNKTF